MSLDFTFKIIIYANICCLTMVLFTDHHHKLTIHHYSWPSCNSIPEFLSGANIILRIQKKDWLHLWFRAKKFYCLGSVQVIIWIWGPQSNQLLNGIWTISPWRFFSDLRVLHFHFLKLGKTHQEKAGTMASISCLQFAWLISFNRLLVSATPVQLET